MVAFEGWLEPEIRPYAAELVDRVHRVYRDRLVSIFAVGSLALGDYRHGRSDIDIVVVVDPATPPGLTRDLIDLLAHPGFPCPAAGVELVVYDADFAAAGAPGAGYLLNLNTGPLLPAVADTDSAAAPGFWYLIDRAIGYQSGRLLSGAAVRDVLGAPARHDVLAAVAESVAEHSTGPGHLGDNRVLNGCRSAYFCRTGRWVAKREAGRSIAAVVPRFRPLLESALSSFERPRGQALDLPSAEIGDFLSWVRRSVAEAAV